MPMPAKVVSAEEQAKRDAERSAAFKRDAGIRTAKVVKEFETLAKCASRTSYNFSQGQLDQIMKAINTASETCFGKFKAALAAPAAKGGKQKTTPFVFAADEPAAAVTGEATGEATGQKAEPAAPAPAATVEHLKAKGARK